MLFYLRQMGVADAAFGADIAAIVVLESAGFWDSFDHLGLFCLFGFDGLGELGGSDLF